MALPHSKTSEHKQLIRSFNKMSKQIFSKIAKIGEEVRSVNKVELYSIDELDQAATYLEEFADDLKALKKSMQADMRRIEGIQMEGIDMFRSIQKGQSSIESMAKQLGVNPSSIAQYAAAEKALQAWSDANSMKI
jgi:predicted  nucleic acid-binding Zn-ribbon protein